MQAPAVVTFGRTLMDIVIQPLVALPLKHSAAKIDTAKNIPGGSAVNTAIALHLLSCPAVVVSAIGRDILGSALKAEIARLGVRTCFATLDGKQTSFCLVALAPNGTARYLYTEGADCHQDRKIFDRQDVRNLLKAPSTMHVHFGGVNLLRGLTGSDFAEYVEGIRSTYPLLTVSMDLSKVLDYGTENQAAIGKADVVFATQDEARALVGGQGMLNLQKLGESILELGAKVFFLKLGSMGSAVFSHSHPRAQIIQTRNINIKANNLNGPGDVYAASIIRRICQRGGRHNAMNTPPEQWKAWGEEATSFALEYITREFISWGRPLTPYNGFGILTRTTVRSKIFDNDGRDSSIC
ncbi:MAG TPA: carbohydrate kinase family protein [Nitrospira sp.]|nr:carbohydrate kinase family protein [Nitrospira sp.]